MSIEEQQTIINPKCCRIKTHELIPVSKSWSEKPPSCPICHHLDRYRLNIAIGIRGRKSDLCFKDVNISCAGVRIRRRRVEKHRGGKYQLNSLCHSNPRLKWIMSNMLWCSRSHNLATKWLLPLWWLQSFKVIYKNGEHVIAKGDAVYHVQQQEPFKEAACRHQKSGSQQLLHLRFYLFSQNLLSSLLPRLHLLHRQQQITERSTHLSGLVFAVEAVASHGWKPSQPSQQEHWWVLPDPSTASAGWAWYLLFDS